MVILKPADQIIHCTSSLFNHQVKLPHQIVSKTVNVYTRNADPSPAKFEVPRGCIKVLTMLEIVLSEIQSHRFILKPMNRDFFKHFGIAFQCLICMTCSFESSILFDIRKWFGDDNIDNLPTFWSFISVKGGSIEGIWSGGGGWFKSFGSLAPKMAPKAPFYEIVRIFKNISPEVK